MARWPEKVVALASRLKAWVPRAAMGQASGTTKWHAQAENDKSIKRLELLKFLRHGE